MIIFTPVVYKPLLLMLPPEKHRVLTDIVEDLQKIPNIAAIVLGGSYAAGTATPASDLDIGIYYHESQPFHIEAIRQVAQKHAISSLTVTGFYEWGPWVNGGAWIQTGAGKADFLYRNIEQVQATIAKARNGEWDNHYEQQPPYGFSSVMYLAETQICLPLFDPAGLIAQLKLAIQPYPVLLKKNMVQQSLWSAEFTLMHAAYFAEVTDVYNTLGCFTRCIKNMVMALFALNELYPISDKRAIDTLEKAAIKPAGLRDKIDHILSAGKDALNSRAADLQSLFIETVALSEGAYQPLYQLK